MKHKLTFALVAFMTSTAFAAFQAPLPEFKNEKQLAEWRAEKAAEATSQGYAAKETAFYTGKPYLASTGSYAFKYRSYSPEVARWTSEDPSGFPDGPNCQIYAFAPTSGLDPLGLKWVFVGSDSSAGDYSDTFSEGVGIDGVYSASVSISGYTNGTASSLTINVNMDTSINGFFGASASSVISKTFTLNINETSGEVTVSGVDQFKKQGGFWSIGNVASAYNAGIKDGTNVVQGRVAFGHSYDSWGDINLGYEGSGLEVGITIPSVDWTLPNGISFSANKKNE
jgi:RHS repeat-associated protein